MGRVDDSGLQVTVARLGPAAHVASVSGELDAVTCPVLLRRLRPIAERGGSQLIVDLGCVTFADAAALDVLAATAELLGRTGGELVVATDDPRLRRLFEAPRAAASWQLERTLVEAVERVVARQYA
jgi:anti-sigma B factor antagonist